MPLTLSNVFNRSLRLAGQKFQSKSGNVGPLPAHQKVLGDNIGQATQFVATGAAQAGITALALAQAPEIAQSLQALPLPADLHAPLHQRMVLLKGAGAAAAAAFALDSHG